MIKALALAGAFLFKIGNIVFLNIKAIMSHMFKRIPLTKWKISI